MTTITAEREPRAIEWHSVRETLRSMLWLAQRQVRNTLRVPAEFIPSMIFPLFFYIVHEQWKKPLWLVLPSAAVCSNGSAPAGLSVTAAVADPEAKAIFPSSKQVVSGRGKSPWHTFTRGLRPPLAVNITFSSRACYFRSTISR